MDKLPKHFYAKFKISKKSGLMRKMMISEDKSTIDAWKGINSEKDSPNDPEEHKQLTAFRRVARDFEKSMDTFQITVPFIMRALPMMEEFFVDMNIRGFIAKNGERLDPGEEGKGEFELYRTTIDHIPKVTKEIQQATAIHSGINHIPALFVIGLVNAYDGFLSQLIRCIFTVQPELLSSSERNLTFKDLVEIGSLDAARERIIEKEVEAVIRDSHAQQIDWLERKLGMKLRKDLTIWPEFIELCERRNLLSHTAGVISSQYLSVCKSHNVDVAGLKIGEMLKIRTRYFARAVSVIQEFGIKLTQVVWRKIRPDEIGEADRELSLFGYRLITKRRYKEAIVMLRFGLYEMKKHGNDATRKMMVVNLANAEKLIGNKAEAERVLQNEDFSAATDNYRICVAAVRDDVPTVIKLMKPVVDGGLLHISDFQEWPIFETVRSDPVFIEAFEREFDKRIVADHQAPTGSKAEGKTVITEKECVAGPTDAAEWPDGKTLH